MWCRSLLLAASLCACIEGPVPPKGSGGTNIMVVDDRAYVLSDEPVLSDVDAQKYWLAYDTDVAAAWSVEASVKGAGRRIPMPRRVYQRTPNAAIPWTPVFALAVVGGWRWSAPDADQGCRFQAHSATSTVPAFSAARLDATSVIVLRNRDAPQIAEQWTDGRKSLAVVISPLVGIGGAGDMRVVGAEGAPPYRVAAITPGLGISFAGAVLPGLPWSVAEPAAPGATAHVYTVTEHHGVFRVGDGTPVAVASRQDFLGNDLIFSLDDTYALLPRSTHSRTATSAVPLIVELSTGPSTILDPAIIRITTLAHIPDLGLIAGATARVEGVGETGVLLRYDPRDPAEPWYLYAILDGHLDILALAPHRNGVLFGSDAGLGFYAAADGACRIDAPVSEVSRIVALASGAFFFFAREAGSSAHIDGWLSPL